MKYKKNCVKTIAENIEVGAYDYYRALDILQELSGLGRSKAKNLLDKEIKEV
jgi:hypothetical protein|tara:strand:- start:247 stop:402 length:156 start_codon:yes stop_codon:yes gene_type:complete